MHRQLGLGDNPLHCAVALTVPCVARENNPAVQWRRRIQSRDMWVDCARLIKTSGALKLAHHSLDVWRLARGGGGDARVQFFPLALFTLSIQRGEPLNQKEPFTEIKW